MTAAYSTLYTDETVTTRFLTFLLGRILSGDPEALDAWQAGGHQFTEAVETERERALVAVLNAVSEHRLALSADATAFERFLVFTLCRILAEDDAAYRGWLRLPGVHAFCETNRELTLCDLVDATAEHYKHPDPVIGLPGWLSYTVEVFTGQAV